MCSLLDVVVYSRPPYMTRAAFFMRATPGCSLCSSLRICSCKEGGATDGLSSRVVQKWTSQPSWVIARTFARTGFRAVWRAISKTEKGCLSNYTNDTWKILSSTLASFLYCRGSLDKASELATSAEGLNSISYWYRMRTVGRDQRRRR